jgi:anti-sigma regulatory factor (Ser/Thr protein kinase)
MSSQHRRETFGRDDREIARARAFVREVFDGWDLVIAGPVLGDLQLVMSELVANALLHGSGTIGVDLSLLDGCLRLEVRDGGGASLPRVRPGESVGGWGLRFVDQLSDRWGVDHDATGTIVWIERRLVPPATSPTTAMP